MVLSADTIFLLISGNSGLQKKSPDFASLEMDQELNSMKLIEQTIQVIEQSSKEMEENVDAMVRCPSRSSQRSATTNASGSRPVTPSSPTKKLSKVPPPVSPKPKFLLMKRAPLAQPEPDDLGTSTDSVEFRAGLFPEVSVTPSTTDPDPDRKTIPKRVHHRSTSRRRSSAGQENVDKTTESVVLGGSAVNIVTVNSTKRPCVDNEAQADSGTASSECGGSVCSCSGGSQCSLVNSGVVSETNGDGEEKIEKVEVVETQKSADIVSPIDEQAEWSKVSI